MQHTTKKSKTFLSVYIAQALVGTLNDAGFTYATSWDRHPLSLSLSLSRRFFPIEDCAFFFNLLPEGRQLENLTGALVRAGILSKTASRLELLWVIGKDLCGAIQILPENEIPSFQNEYEPFDFTACKTVSAMNILRQDTRLRFSLAGEQQKIALLLKDDTFFLPLYGSVSSHILKFQSVQFPHVVENEFFCTRLAEVIGLNVHKVDLLCNEQTSALLLKRFDRMRQGIDLLRLHYEDFCQAQGLSAYEKYDCPSDEGYMGLAQCFAVLTNPNDRVAFFDMFIFNFLIGNADAHRKNFSWLITSEDFRLAPFYDILSTCIYPDVEQNFALALNNNFSPFAMRREDLHILITLANLTEKESSVRIQQMVQTISFAGKQVAESCLNRLTKSPCFFDIEICLAKIQEYIGFRCQQLKTLFSTLHVKEKIMDDFEKASTLLVQSVAKSWVRSAFQDSTNGMDWNEFMLDLKTDFEKNDRMSNRLWNTLHWCDDTFSQQDLHRAIIDFVLHYNDPVELQAVANNWLNEKWGSSNETRKDFLASLKSSFEKNAGDISDEICDTRYWTTDTFSAEQLKVTIVKIVMEQAPKKFPKKATSLRTNSPR